MFLSAIPSDCNMTMLMITTDSRPGRNVTGVANLNAEVTPKRLELLHELVLNATVIPLLVNPTNTALTESVLRASQAAAQALGLKLHVLNAARSPPVVGSAKFTSPGQLASKLIRL